MGINLFSKYVMKDDHKEDIFHSSAYAKEQSGAGMGAASSESFSARRSVDSSRQFVGGYGNSRMATGSVNRMQAKAYTPPTPASKPVPTPPKPGLSHGR